MSGVDSIYFVGSGRISIARTVSAKARTNVFKLFMREMAPTRDTAILDVGCADEEGPETNMLEQLYPFPAKITGAGLGDGREFRKRYSSRYVQIEANKPLPFPDKAFDIVWSNAVLEHVGGRKERAEFVRELQRIGRRVFIVVPNRWFPVEHHSAIPFLHWNARLFRYLLRKTSLRFWADSKNMDFLSRHLLLREFPQARSMYAGLRCSIFSSNIVLMPFGSRAD